MECHYIVYLIGKKIKNSETYLDLLCILSYTPARSVQWSVVHGMKITMDRSAAYTLYLWRFLPENICATHFWLKITSVSAEIRGHSWLNRYYNQLNNPPLFEAFWGIQSFISCRPLNCASTVRKVWLFQYFLVKIYTIVSSSIYHYTNAITILR